jgi:hypothetical protein
VKLNAQGGCGRIGPSTIAASETAVKPETTHRRHWPVLALTAEIRSTLGCERQDDHRQEQPAAPGLHVKAAPWH